MADRQSVERLPPVGGLGAVLAGSCSPATLGQIEVMREKHATRALDPLRLAADDPRRSKQRRHEMKYAKAGRPRDVSVRQASPAA